MNAYPNYRVAVEAVLVRGGRALLARRADDCAVAPGKWNVPAGKVKYEEVPREACVREAREETGLRVKVVRELGARAFKGEDARGEPLYRLVYTYLVEGLDGAKEPVINEEHSEFRWVSKGELDGGEFDSLSPALKEILKANL